MTSYKTRNIKTSVFVSLSLLVLIVLQASAWSAVKTIEPIQCAYHPNSGQPNPLGPRAFITIKFVNGDTHFRYERYPSPVFVSDSGKPRAASIESHRTLVLYDTDIELARELVRRHSAYYHELIGYEDDAGFSRYDEALSCE